MLHVLCEKDVGHLQDNLGDASSRRPLADTFVCPLADMKGRSSSSRHEKDKTSSSRHEKDIVLCETIRGLIVNRTTSSPSLAGSAVKVSWAQLWCFSLRDTRCPGVLVLLEKFTLSLRQRQPGNGALIAIG